MRGVFRVRLNRPRRKGKEQEEVPEKEGGASGQGLIVEVEPPASKERRRVHESRKEQTRARMQRDQHKHCYVQQEQVTGEGDLAVFVRREQNRSTQAAGNMQGNHCL